ncbi:MAG: DNA translocase FtsK 4TM domain-containing protein [Lachnospiraceae bacterium]|nr:DNA translocase FtsK 4TM domain-containing protein [Lachnospiraceae bacterium]
MASQVKKTSGNGSNKKTTTSKSSSASRPKSTASAKKTTKKKTTNTKSNKAKVIDEKDIVVSNDIKIITGFAVMILLTLSNFSLMGKVGDLISYLMFGLFGLLAYLFPIMLFAAISFFIANLSSRHAMRKLIASVILFTMICLIIQLIYVGADGKFTLSGVYKICATEKNGGGLLGALFAVVLCSTIGIYGAYVVAIAVVIVCIVIISEKSFVNGVKNHSKQAYDYAKEDFRKMKENSAKRIEDREKNKEVKRENNREAKKEVKTNNKSKNIIKGVNLSAMVTGDAPELADVHELVGNGSLYRGHVDIDENEQNKSSNTIEKTVRSSMNTNPTGFSGTILRSESGISRNQVDNTSVNNNFNSQGIQAASIDTNKQVVGSDVLKQEEEKRINEEVKNGEYAPRERIEVSKSAMEVMNRKAFAGVNTAKTISNDVPVPDVNAGVKEKPMTPEQVGTGVKSKEYVMPPLSLLRKGSGFKGGSNNSIGISDTAVKLQETLNAFGVKATVINESKGPSVTRYELQPETGTKVSKITSLADDIKLNLAASDIRIEAPIPGKAAVGIEVPNDKRESVFLRDLIESKELKSHPSKLAFAAGMDIAGQVIVADIAKMPHMLIAGTTGSGKSVFTNSIIMSILFRAKPSEVRLIIVDPKVVEFGVYNGIPHLLTPVVTDPRKAAGALNWAVGEMSDRYSLFAKYGVRDLKGYNEKIKQMNYKDGDEELKPKPQIVIIIDELADLMMVASKEVESAICRLAQLARAAGIHLIIATQRPSVDVVTGLIKANIPSRVALLVSSGTDSRTIIDCNGGEKLLGNGDMLFYPSGYVKPVRLQGAFVSDDEVQGVVSFLINNNQDVQYNEAVASAEVVASAQDSPASSEGDERDVLFEQAARFVIEKEKGSTSMLQRMFKIGFNRAARIVEQLEKEGIVGPDEGTKPRKVLMTMEEFEEMF